MSMFQRVSRQINVASPLWFLFERVPETLRFGGPNPNDAEHVLHVGIRGPRTGVLVPAFTTHDLACAYKDSPDHRFYDKDAEEDHHERVLLYGAAQIVNGFIGESLIDFLNRLLHKEDTHLLLDPEVGRIRPDTAFITIESMIEMYSRHYGPTDTGSGL